MALPLNGYQYYTVPIQGRMARLSGPNRLSSRLDAKTVYLLTVIHLSTYRSGH